MEKFIGPRDGKKLLPPTRSNVGDVETEDERERDEIEERIEVFDDIFEEPLLGVRHTLAVDDSEDGIDNEEEEEFSADEFVEGALPLEEEPREPPSGGGGHIPLV